MEEWVWPKRKYIGKWWRMGSQNIKETVASFMDNSLFSPLKSVLLTFRLMTIEMRKCLFSYLNCHLFIVLSLRCGCNLRILSIFIPRLTNGIAVYVKVESMTKITVTLVNPEIPGRNSSIILCSTQGSSK